MLEPDLSPAPTDSKTAHVLQVVPTLDSGGAERTAVDVATHLVREGWQATVASAGGRMVGELEAAGAIHVEAPMASKNPVVMARNVTRLRRLIRERRIDVVHARSRAPAWSALAAARAENVPFVTTYHAVYGQGEGALAAPKAFYNSVMGRGRRVIANSLWTAGIVAERHPELGPRLVTIPRGADLSRFDPQRRDDARTAELRDRWQVPADAFVFMLVARLSRRKGQGETIEAFASIAPERPETHLLLVGDDNHAHDYASALRERIAALPPAVASRIRMTGHFERPHEALALADVALMPSVLPEGFGRTAVEASASELPVIVTDIGATPETVVEGETGYRVPPADVPALAEAMARLADMTERERAVMGAAGRRFALAHYRIETMCERTLDVYRAVLAEHEGHPAQP